MKPLPPSCPMEVLPTVSQGLIKLHKRQAVGHKVHLQVCSKFSVFFFENFHCFYFANFHCFFFKNFIIFFQNYHYFFSKLSLFFLISLFSLHWSGSNHSIFSQKWQIFKNLIFL